MGSVTATTPMERADELLREMTVEEKAMQVSCVVPLALLGPDGPMRGQLETLLGDGIGHVAGIGLLGHKMPDEIARSVNAIQRYLVTETRLKIPAIFHNEALNGVVAPGFSAFPTPLALAATWDPEAVREMADILRRQMRAVGLLHALSPVMDVARDARWGRVTETYGEDPYLVSAMSVAFTRGMQGDDLREGVIACAKHFLGYAMTEAGQNMAATAVGPRELHDVYARPFEAAIRLAGLGGVMASYSEYDGIPIDVSRPVLTDLLRGRLGFTGTVVSDYNGIGWAQTRQLVAATPEEVGPLGVTAGMDVELPGVHGYGKVLAEAVAGGRLEEAQLDESVRRVLRDKFALGLFDDPYVREDPVEIRGRASDGDDLSRRLAAESVTLLKNDGGLLPLGRDVAKVAVVGPHADSTMVGFPHYTYPAGVAMIRVAARLGFFPMPGVGELPKEGFAALTSELERAQGDVEDYARANYPAVSLTEAIRRLLRKPRSRPSPAPACCPRSRPTSGPRWPRPGRPTWSSSMSAARAAATATTSRRRKAATPRTSTCRRSRWSWSRP
jgi:beta-xylosidase